MSCLTLHETMNCITPTSSVLHDLPEFAQTHVYQVGDAIQPSHLCRPLLLLPSIFPSIRVSSNESALRIGWPKDWSFSFSLCDESFLVKRKQRSSTLCASLLKLNFPIKHPGTGAAVTAGSEGGGWRHSLWRPQVDPGSPDVLPS